MMKTDNNEPTSESSAMSKLEQPQQPQQPQQVQLKVELRPMNLGIYRLFPRSETYTENRVELDFSRLSSTSDGVYQKFTVETVEILSAQAEKQESDAAASLGSGPK